MKPELVPYDPTWPQKFEEEKKRILAHVRANVLDEIEHFGSTSVPGMWAKPIIDIQCYSSEMPPSETLMNEILQLGYEYREQPGTQPNEYMRFDLGKSVVTACLHVRNKRGMTNSLYTRNFLRIHPEWVEKYSSAKRQIFQEQGNSISMREYRTNKQNILDELEVAVTEWMKENKFSAD